MMRSMIMNKLFWGDKLEQHHLDKLEGKTFYGNDYELGDRIGYVMIPRENSTCSEMTMATIVEREWDRFLSEYEIVKKEGSKDSPIIRVEKKEAA